MRAISLPFYIYRIFALASSNFAPTQHLPYCSALITICFFKKDNLTHFSFTFRIYMDFFIRFDESGFFYDGCIPYPVSFYKGDYIISSSHRIVPVIFCIIEKFSWLPFISCRWTSNNEAGTLAYFSHRVPPLENWWACLDGRLFLDIFIIRNWFLYFFKLEWFFQLRANDTFFNNGLLATVLAWVQHFL